ncbi:unnamed protein product [Ixodes persulcatus]
MSSQIANMTMTRPFLFTVIVSVVVARRDVRTVTTGRLEAVVERLVDVARRMVCNGAAARVGLVRRLPRGRSGRRRRFGHVTVLAVRLGEARGRRVVRFLLDAQRRAASVAMVVLSWYLDFGNIQVLRVQALGRRARTTSSVVVAVLVVEYRVKAAVLDGRVSVDHAVVLGVRAEALEHHVQPDQRDADADEQHDAQDDAEDHGRGWSHASRYPCTESGHYR